MYLKNVCGKIVLTITKKEGKSMYIKVPLDAFKDNHFSCLQDIYLYSFLCGFSDKEDEEVKSHYKNEQLADIFGCHHDTITASITRLANKGLLKRIVTQGWSRKSDDFYCARTLVVYSKWYHELMKDSDYITVQTHWLSEWKLPIRATQMLGLFWTVNKLYKEQEDIFKFTHTELMEQLNISHPTYQKNFNLLQELGFINLLVPKNITEKVVELVMKNADKETSMEEALEKNSDIYNTALEMALEHKNHSNKAKQLLVWCKRVLKHKKVEIVEAIAKLLDKTFEVIEPLGAIWKAFNYQERRNMRKIYM